jgi:hypothetical protein
MGGHRTRILPRTFASVENGSVVVLVRSLPVIARMRINHPLTLLSLVIPLGISAITCADPSEASPDDTQQQAEAARTAIATMENMLPADGCSYPVTIDGVQYAPDARSKAVAQELVPAGGSITARISYRLTGRVGQVECGFGNTLQLPEISFRVLEVIE